MATMSAFQNQQLNVTFVSFNFQSGSQPVRAQWTVHIHMTRRWQAPTGVLVFSGYFLENSSISAYVFQLVYWWILFHHWLEYQLILARIKIIVFQYAYAGRIVIGLVLAAYTVCYVWINEVSYSLVTKTFRLLVSECACRKDLPYC
jgi:hypothetical protein